MNRKIQKECESTCEYILPDYMGDIKKILNAKAVAVPAGSFQDGDLLVVNGVVEYEVLYTDSENKLTAVVTTSDYSMNVAVDGDNYVDAIEDSESVNLSIRITGPRKITMKSSVACSLTVVEENEIGVEGDVFDGDRSPECIKTSVEYEESVFATATEREYAEEAERINGVSADDIEIITTGARVKIIETRSVDNGVEIKGEIIATAIIKTPQQPPYVIKKSIPFNEIINIEGSSPDMLPSARGYVTSATCGVNSDADGAVIVVNTIAEFKAELRENKSTTVVCDAYLKEQETKNDYCAFEYRRAEGVQNSEIVFDMKMPRSEIMLDNVQSILSSNADIIVSEAEIGRGEVRFTGEMHISGIACEINADDSVGYLPIKFKLPFDKNVNINCHIPENASVEYTITPIDCQPSLDGENLYVRCTAVVSVRLYTVHKVDRLKSCELVEGARYTRNPSTVTVYYPLDGDSLFRVAKQFHTTPEKIAKDNSLTDSVMSTVGSSESLNGVKKLIIR